MWTLKSEVKWLKNYFYVYLCVSLCVCVFLYICDYDCVYRTEVNPRCCSSEVIHLTFWDWIALWLELTNSSRPSDIQASGLNLFQPPQLWNSKYEPAHLAFVCGYWRSGTSPHACEASSFLSEISSQPLPTFSDFPKTFVLEKNILGYKQYWIT